MKLIGLKIDENKIEDIKEVLNKFPINCEVNWDKLKTYIYVGNKNLGTTDRFDFEFFSYADELCLTNNLQDFENNLFNEIVGVKLPKLIDVYIDNDLTIHVYHNTRIVEVNGKLSVLASSLTKLYLTDKLIEDYISSPFSVEPERYNFRSLIGMEAINKKHKNTYKIENFVIDCNNSNPDKYKIQVIYSNGYLQFSRGLSEFLEKFSLCLN